MSSHGFLSDSDSESMADSLSTGDTKPVKNILRASESTAARETTHPVKEPTEEQNDTPAFITNRDDTNSAPAPADPVAAQIAKDRLKVFNKYIRKSDDLKREISELLLQLQRVGGNETASIVWVMSDANDYIFRLDEALDDASQHYVAGAMDNTMLRLRDLEVKCSDILKSLYRQNHAFRFLQRLVGDLTRMQNEIVLQQDLKRMFSLLFEVVVPKLKKSFSHLKKDFRSFSNKTLPEFVTEEEERDTTRYLSLTTIATFFSSITATTLQFSFEGETKPLSGAVHLFWYLSLVFSVSSGINSLLSMLWRKSAVYSEETRAPKCFKLWLTDAPIYFLAISAFAFIIGLSLFVYSSNQSTYVATTTIGFAALHVLCLLIVMSWFIVRRNWSTIFMQSLRRYLSWILLLENEVFDANRFFGTTRRNWPKNVTPPSTPAKLLRFFATLLRAGFRILKRYILAPFLKIPLLLAFLRDVIKRLKRSKWAPNESAPPASSGDLEKGKRRVAKVAAAEPRPPTETDRAIEEFISVLRDTFTGSDSIAVADFRKRVSDWAKRSYPADIIENALRSLLWGYPDLLQQFQQKVLPAMKSEEHSYEEKMGSNPRQQVVNSHSAGNQSSVNQSPIGLTTTINAGGPEDDEVHEQSPSRTKQLVTPERTRKAAGASDVGPSDQSIATDSTAGDGRDDTARVSSSLMGVVEEKGSDDERIEEGSEKKSHKAAKGLSRREVR